ncbi:MAG: sulfite exporter TauE/SafE family protein [Lachnospiraceae bacterium]|nr:sulfite exporter TauE/SafE family protein [Lachnospiraceae bacterium]MBQ4305351.1 sulfite exporter TauE/SafE family protein [Lachnospiraceae bacterium]
MSFSIPFFVMLIVAAGSCIQSALGFGATMVTMGFLPLIMDYSKAMGISIIMVSISTICISIKYRKSIRWDALIPFVIPTALICGTVNLLSASVSSQVMYLLLGFMFIAVSVFFFVFSSRISIKPTPLSGAGLGLITGIFYGLFASGGPTAALYLMPATKDKKEYLATIQAFLCVNNLVILLISLALSRLDMADLPVIGTGIAGMLAGTLMGLAIHDRIPASIFGKVIYAFVGVGGLWIIISHLI